MKKRKRSQFFSLFKNISHWFFRWEVFILLVVITVQSCFPKKETPYLVIFSLDGFRWDYANYCQTPVLDSLEEYGVKANAMVPSFPSLTFPNHYSIATGLYPGHHGIVQNNFYNKYLRRKYSLGDRESVEDSSFYKGTPLWNLLQMNGIKTATCFWVGSEAPVNGLYATYWKKYDSHLSFKNRMDTVIHWLNLPEEKRPHLIMSYFSEPDHTGHDFGPYGVPTRQQVESVDSVLGYFFHQLHALPFGDKVNVIVLSDHGMTSVDSAQNVVVADHIKDSWVKAFNGGSTCLFIEPKDHCEDSIYEELKKLSFIEIYKRNELPKSWHYDDPVNVDKLVVVAKLGYKFKRREYRSTSGGAHGYLNTEQDMKTIFYAIGPKFKERYSQPEFENVNVFPLVEEIFQVPERIPSDGDLDQVRGMLR